MSSPLLPFQPDSSDMSLYDEQQFSALNTPFYSPSHQSYPASQDRPPRCAPSGWPDSSAESDVPVENPAYHGLYMDLSYLSSYNHNSFNFEHADRPGPLSWPEQSYDGTPLYPLADSGVLSPCYSPLSSGASSSDGALFSSPMLEYPNVFDITFGNSLASASSYASHDPNYSLPSPISAASSSTSSSPSPPSPPLEMSTSKLKSKLSSSAPSDPNNNHRRRFPCLTPGCSRRFTSQYTLKVHMEAHKPKPRVTFPCTLGCSERFSRQHDRLRHEVAKHNKVCEFSCDECGRFFGSAKTLGNHRCPAMRDGMRWVHS